MVHHKIVFSGPAGAGKSTAIRSVSDDAPLLTDARASDATRAIKDVTTVALDYGAFDLDNGDRVHVYGTPGQERFDFMWEILAEGAVGLVLLIPNDHPEPLAELRFFLRAFASILDRSDVVVGVTRTDRSPDPTIEQYREVLSELGLSATVLEVDARRPRDVLAAVHTLLRSVAASSTT